MCDTMNIGLGGKTNSVLGVLLKIKKVEQNSEVYNAMCSCVHLKRYLVQLFLNTVQYHNGINRTHKQKK